MERESTAAPFFDVPAIAEALECQPEQRGPNVVSFSLTNEPLNVSVRLDVIETGRAVSLYL
jgi:hypothetical protein